MMNVKHSYLDRSAVQLISDFTDLRNGSYFLLSKIILCQYYQDIFFINLVNLQSTCILSDPLNYTATEQ